MKTLNVVLITAQISYVDHLLKLRLKAKKKGAFLTTPVHAMKIRSVVLETALTLFADLEIASN